MAKVVKLYVTAPEGRYITGLGNREAGQFYELSEKQARALAGRDPGLSLDDPNAVKEQAPKPEKE